MCLAREFECIGPHRLFHSKGSVQMALDVIIALQLGKIDWRRHAKAAAATTRMTARRGGEQGSSGRRREDMQIEEDVGTVVGIKGTYL